MLEYGLQSKSYGPPRERGEYSALERNELSRREKTRRALNAVSDRSQAEKAAYDSMVARKQL